MKKIIYFIALISSSLLAQNLQNGLQVHYLFDGNTTDNSINGHHLQNGIGSVTYTTVSGLDQAVYFDGNNRLDQIGSLDNSSWTASAMSIWIKTTHTSTQDQSIIQGAYLGFNLYLESNNSYSGGFFDGNSSNTLYNANSLADDEWHHIVYQSNGTTTSVYIDGVFIASIQEPYFTGNGTSNNKIYMGQAIISPRPYTGFVNDCRIYNRTLSLCEIQMLAGLNSTSANTLYETSCSDYLWLQTNLEYSETGIYTDTLLNSLGCDSIITLDLTIENLDTTVTVGNGMLTSNASGVSYDWIDCDNNSIVNNGQSFYPNNLGNYAVIISDGTCLDTSDCYTVNKLSVENTYKEDFIKVINKSGFGSIEIELEQINPQAILNIRNVRGQLIDQISANEKFIELTLNQIGVYFIEYRTTESLITKKFIIY